MTEPLSQPGNRSFLGSAEARIPAARLGVAVVHDLVSAIVSGEVPSGDSLPPEGVLSQHFGVSRTVIRESVKRIEEKGLVTVVQGRGTQVQPPSTWNMLDPVVLTALVEHDDSVGVLDELAVVRGALEGSMAAQAASARTTAELEQLQAAFAHMNETIHQPDAFGQADVDFHFLVMSLSGNRLAENINKILFQRALESARFSGTPTEEAFRLTLEEHRRVLEAVEKGDEAEAEAAMRAHIADAWQRRRLPTHKKV
jgi:GntR family galactonate operon transcriptional repressor